MRSPAAVRRVLGAVFALVCAVAAHAARADEPYPSRPITLINPYAPGGPADILARVVGKALGEDLHTAVVVQNKPGAGAAIGAAYVAHATPDGYTLLVGTAAAHSVTPVLTKVNYDGFNSFRFIGMLGSFFNVLVVNPSVQARTLPDLIALAKSEPGKLAFATTGLGTSTHLAGVMLQQRAHIEFNEVQYKGAAPELNDLVAGQVQLAFSNTSAVEQFVKLGQLHAIAIAGPARSDLMPQVPTFAQAGLPGFESSTWYILAAPAGTPQPVLDKLARALARVHKSAEYREQMHTLGADILDMSPAQVTAFVQDDAQRTLQILKASKLGVN
jgi:tripartite-type tricarboxylate transporter receptor subunit TctC